MGAKMLNKIEGVEMNRLRIILFFACCVVSLNSAVAQLTSVQLNTNGTKPLLGVTIGGVGEVVVDTHGNIKNIVLNDKFNNSAIDNEYYSDYNSYEAGKIKSIGDVKFTYYSDFNSYEAGKIKSIGNITFTYYSKFNSYEAAKIKSVGGKSIKYHSAFNDYESGKIKSVSGVALNYYSKFNDYEAGKIKSIGSHKYEYLSNFSDDSGRLKSGSRSVTIDGVKFVIRERRMFY